MWWREIGEVENECTSHSLPLCHLSAKNYQNRWKFDEALTKNNFAQFFRDTVYNELKCDSWIVTVCAVDWARRRRETCPCRPNRRWCVRHDLGDTTPARTCWPGSDRPPAPNCLPVRTTLSNWWRWQFTLFIFIRAVERLISFNRVIDSVNF